MSEQALKSLEAEQAARLTNEARSTPGLLKNREFRKFQTRYRDDTVAFAMDCIDWKESSGLTHYQAQIMGDFQVYDRQAVRGPRGLGKTTMAAIIVLAWALTHDGEDWKVGTTASVWRQLEDYLWPEVHKWAARLRWEKIGRLPFNTRTELLTMKLILSNRARATAIASDDSETIEGLHAEFLKVIFDEAKIVQDETWDSLEGALSNAGEHGDVAKVLAISTPGAPGGRFYDIHSRKPGYEDWHPVHITMEDAIKAHRMTREWADMRLAQWGTDSALYQNQVLGEFAADDEDVIIPLAFVEASNRRWDDWQARLKSGGSKGVVTSMGLDVALGGAGRDQPIFTKVYDNRYVELEVFKPRTLDTQTMEIAGRAKELIDRHNVRMYIDVGGLGVGVYNRLREQGVKLAIAFNAAEKAPRKLKDASGEYTFKNKRAAMWFIGRDILNPDEGSEIALPRDADLSGELTRTREKSVLSDAVRQVESKEEIRKRINRSTDRADSVLQALTGSRVVSSAPTRVYVVGRGYID